MFSLFYSWIKYNIGISRAIRRQITMISTAPSLD